MSTKPFLLLLASASLLVQTSCAPLVLPNTYQTPYPTAGAYPAPIQTSFPATETPAPYPPPPSYTSIPSETPSIFVPLTPTPLPQGFAPPSPVVATETTYEISATVDLSATLPLEQKSEIIVLRLDGSYIKYLVPPAVPLDEIPLQQGDVIVQISSPQADFGNNPLPQLPTAISTVAP